MVNLFNSFSSPYDDLVNHLGSSGQGSAQARRKTTNNPNIKVKEANKSDHHEIQIFNKTGYKNFKIEVVKQGQEYYLMVQSSVDRFEKFFKLNPSNDNLQNVKSQIVDDWLIISIPFNAKNQTKTTPKKQTNTPKKQPNSPIPAKSPTPAKSPPPSKIHQQRLHKEKAHIHVQRVHHRQSLVSQKQRVQPRTCFPEARNHVQNLQVY